MKINRRNSKLKHIRKTSFLRRRRTKGGKAIINNHRRTRKLKLATKRRRVRREQAHRSGCPK